MAINQSELKLETAQDELTRSIQHSVQTFQKVQGTKITGTGIMVVYYQNKALKVEVSEVTL